MAMAKQFLPMCSAITSWKLSFWFRSKRNEIWTAYHSTRSNMKILCQTFPGKLISRFDGVEWPARSGHLKGGLYRNWPTDIYHPIEDSYWSRNYFSTGQENLIKAMNKLCPRTEICVQPESAEYNAMLSGFYSRLAIF